MDHHRASTSGSDQMPAPVPTFRPQKPEEVNEHIYQLYKPENGEPTMEILFFHGLQFGNSPGDPPYLSTWRTQDTSKEVWPGTWLPQEFPQAQVFSISYDASMRITEEHGRFDLYNLAENLVQAIGWAGIGQGVGRPVIFVGHCFGGLAIKELLVQADQTHHSRGPDLERNQQIGNFLKNIGGVFFYGTPHRGSHLLDKAAYFLDGPLLSYVKSLSTESARLEQRFVSICSQYNMHFIASVGESRETSLVSIRKSRELVLSSEEDGPLIQSETAMLRPMVCLFPPTDLRITEELLARLCMSATHGSQKHCHEMAFDRGIFHGLVVPEASARYGDFYTATADHISLCKPAKKTSNSFLHLIRFIQRIIPKVQGEASLEKIHPRVPKAAIGLDLGVENIREMLQRNTCKSLGIFGMGGIGKTTLARELLNKLGPTFECTCFVYVVKQISGTVEDVKKEMWKHMLCGSQKVEHWSQVQGKKLLVVLDDVASKRDLEVGEAIVDDGAPTSRLVVTSRDRELLKNMDNLYVVPYFNEKDAKHLFVNYAFPGQVAPPLVLDQCVKSIVEKCHGLPLTLEVLGKYLKGQEKVKLWEQTLEALDKADHVAGFDEDLWAKLELSYINLRKEEQQMFLDATTFFSLEDWTLREAKAAWSANYRLVDLRWHTLVERSLVYDGEEDKPIKVHEQLQSLGRKLASNGKSIRSWTTMEGWNLLQSKDITNDQEIHSLRLSRFEHCENDYFLDIDQPQVLESGPSKLKKVQYLDIPNYDLNHIVRWHDQCRWSLPWHLIRLLKKTLGKPGMLSFRDLLEKMFPTKLVLLRSPTLQFGPILCDPILLPHLRVLKLDLPFDVKHLPGSIGQLSMLKILSINAPELMQLPNEIKNLSQLERLTFYNCFSLETLPKTFGHLSNLEHLVFKCCWKLHSLPESFCQLHMLQHLKFKFCPRLCTLPESLGLLCQLKHLSLGRCGKLLTLPKSIGQLSNLEKLFIRYIPIETLPFSPGCLKALRHLRIVGTFLESIPNWVQTLPLLEILEFRLMSNLKELPPFLRKSLPSHARSLLDPSRWSSSSSRRWTFYRTQDGHFSYTDENSFH